MLVGTQLVDSNGEAKRKIQEGAVEIDGKRVDNMQLPLSTNHTYQIRLGKKFIKLDLKEGEGIKFI